MQSHQNIKVCMNMDVLAQLNVEHISQRKLHNKKETMSIKHIN